MRLLLLFTFLLLLLSLALPEKRRVRYDCILRGGTIYDGSGEEGYVADLAINADTIAMIGNLRTAYGQTDYDVTGYAVAPGFINMLSWADLSLAHDGRSLSGIKQGVTVEVMGEGYSPRLPDTASAREDRFQWNTLDEYFGSMEAKGFTPNIASFVGATSIRIKVMGFSARAPDSVSLAEMRTLVAEAMQHGALGLGTALIYPPGAYATTEELIELSKVAAEYGGLYSTHLRSEGEKILEAINETLCIAEEAEIPAKIHHLKINLEPNWTKLDTVLHKIDSARRVGIQVTANLYPYVASATGLTARLPAWVQEGGATQMRRRLRNPSTRAKVLEELRLGFPKRISPPEDVVLMRFRDKTLHQRYTRMSLKEIANHRGKSPDETLIDLIIEDGSRIETLYFQQSEQVMRRIMLQPYVSFGSDAGSFSLDQPPAYLPDHPRAFGTFARILGKYVRDDKILSLREAIRRMTSLPASTLKLTRRGLLAPGYFADVVVFQPDFISDNATYEQPHQYATGVEYVFVNGTLVLNQGEHTNEKPGRILRGPGWRPDF